MSDHGKSSLTTSQFSTAWKYNESHRLFGVQPIEIAKFWIDHCPAGKNYELGDVKTDPGAIVELLSEEGGVQDFLFSVEGDTVMGVPAAPSTKRERDGQFGPMTHRRFLAFLENRKPLEHDTPPYERNGTKLVDYLILGAKRVPIDGVRVITMDEPGGLSIVKASRKGWKLWNKGATPGMAMMKHWDVCWSAQQCFKVLVAQGYGSCFGVDNPSQTDRRVTVYQWGDPGLFQFSHGGAVPNRECRASMDYSNAVYPKYGERYEKMTGIQRPLIVDAECNGTWTCLGMYRGQILAGLRILQAVCNHYGYRPRVNVGRYGGPNSCYPAQVADPRIWNGFNAVSVVTHLEYTKKKVDIAGFWAQVIALALTENAVLSEFPWLEENFRLWDSRWADWLENIRAKWQWNEIWTLAARSDA